MKIWLANMNFQLVVDIEKSIAYMDKYMTKLEIGMSVEINRMMQKQLIKVIKMD